MKPIITCKKSMIILIAAAAILTVAACFALFSIKPVAPDKLIVHEVSDFQELCKTAVSCRDGDRIVFTEPFTLEDSVEISALVSFDFRAQVVFNGFKLTVRSNESGRAEISEDEGIEVEAENVIYDCPECELTWGGSKGIIDTTLYMNLRSLNGKAISASGLGGSGNARITACRMTTADNGWLEEDVEFAVENKEIKGIFPYLASGYGIRHSVLQIEADGEWKALNCDNGDGTVNLCECALIAVSDGENTYNYRITTGRDALDIPVIYIDTENSAEVTSKEEYINAKITIDAAGYKGFDSLPLTDIKICGRGNSSWNFPKTPYKIKFSVEYGLFGLSPAREYALFPNYADKSLMRNRVALEMARLLSFDYTPTQYPADVFVNGEYVGVYTFGEHLETGEDRVDISPELGVEDTDYFIEVGGVESGENTKGFDYFNAGLIKFALIKAPVADYMTDGQFRFIKDYFQKTNDAIVSGGNYADYIDLTTLIDWLIMTEYTNNTDSAFRRSCYFTKKAGGKLKMGPVWDHDLAFGNFSRDDENYSTWATTTEDDYVGTTWSTYLFKDENFMKLFTKRWDEVKDIITKRAFEVAEETCADVLRSQEYNFTVWDILGERVKFERNDITQYATYEQQVMYLEDFLESRYKWLDEKLEPYRDKP